MGYPAITYKCAKGHEWDVIVAPWWFSLRDIKCSRCERQAVQAKWKGVVDPNAIQKEQ